jgi:cytochrome c oxidase accessory protein FixG
VVPWIRFPRGEGIPNQAVLADFENEKFFFFWLEIWPQEVHYLAGLMLLSAFGLFLVTTLFGRVWCGYFCPQTVWTDLFIWVERRFEGDRAARMRLDKAPWSFGKFFKKFGKHTVWLLISFLTGGVFIFYFHDAPTLAVNFFTGEAPLTAYFFAGILTFTTYTLAGTMREQVCTYLCPWPRIQGALTDEHALNVTYRYNYGEPRKAKHKGDSWEDADRGGCIDCDQCVQVCPMGIDIRDGAQMECIHCALCIDACDSMMGRIGWPKNLIGYDTDVAVEQKARGEKPTYRLIRGRSILYAALMILIAAVMVYGWSNRSSFELNVLKDRSPPFIALADGSVRNGYTLKIVNKANEARDMIVRAEGIDGLEMEIVGLVSELPAQIVIPVAAHGVDRYRFLIEVPPGWDKKRERITLSVEDPVAGQTYSDSILFQGPE